LSANSEKSSARHYDPSGPRGLLRRGPNGQGPQRWWPISIIVVAMLVALGFWATKSPWFAARRIDVSGQSHLTRADVLRLAGVRLGANVFWLHGGDLERRLERSPWVADADVAKSLPSTIRITVHERAPVARVRDGDRFLVVAADGTVLGRARWRKDMPLLVLDPTMASSPRDLGRTAWVAGGMSPWLREHVKAIRQTSDGSIVVQLQSGVPVYYRDASSIVAKGRALAAVLRWAIAGKKPLESIDVGAPLAPTARLDIYVAPVTVSVPSETTASPSPGPSPSPSASPHATPSPSASPSPSQRRHTAQQPAHRKKRVRKG
jgi:cell division protein FtsQ